MNGDGTSGVMLVLDDASLAQIKTQKPIEVHLDDMPALVAAAKFKCLAISFLDEADMKRAKVHVLANEPAPILAMAIRGTGADTSDWGRAADKKLVDDEWGKP